MLHWITTLLAALLLGIWLIGGIGAAGAANLSDAEKAAVCAEAEARFKEQFGKSAAEAGAVDKATVILMYKYLFCPEETKVKRGTMLRFVNMDKRTSHSVWFKEQGKEESVRAFGGEIIEVPAEFAAGPQPYICGPHWERDNMVGRVIVVE